MSVRPRLLIADDSIANSTLLQHIVEGLCDVDQTYNGKATLQQLDQQTYDLIMLDMGLPDITGLDVLMMIRQRYDRIELPVILLANMADIDEVIIGVEAGANDYITKPVRAKLVIARVMTQLRMKQLHDESAQMIQKLQVANQMRQQMMQIASHDLKNPLTNLKLLAKVMMRHAGTNAKLQQLIGLQSEGLDTMVNVISDFLDADNFSMEDFEVELHQVDCAPLISNVIDQYLIPADQKNITLNIYDLHGIIIADDRRLIQIVTNLVSNAIKYSPIGGSVTIFCESSADQELWRLNVIDSGTGIAEVEQQHLFQPFVKGSISTKPTNGEDSTGLGLWIVSEMMKLQGGSYGMYNVQQGGACFWIELPLATQNNDAPTA